MNEITTIDERKRKFLLLLPLLFLPFAALLFYSLGGGRGQKTESASVSSGLNTSIPSAQLDERDIDKLSLYQQAERDSLERLKAEDNDPFKVKVDDNQKPDGTKDKNGEDVYTGNDTSPAINSTRHSRRRSNPQEAADEVSQKLASLEKLLADKPIDTFPMTSHLSDPASQADSEIVRLEQMLAAKSGSVKSEDPELNQLDGMLEKILDIQHPDRVQEKLRQESLTDKGQAIPIQTSMKFPRTDVFGGGLSTRTRELPPVMSGSGFYELSDHSTQEQNNAISAVIHESQTVVSGATIKIRLTQDVFVQGQLIPSGSFMYGTCTLNGERLTISIPSFRYRNSIYPVDLSAYDLDGLAGVRVPGSISRDATKQGTDQAIQAMSIGTLDPSLQAQAAAAGIETAKTLLSRKVKLIKVTIKADYPLLLKSSK